MPLVSLAVALILFEGSLTLHLSQWREIGSVVHRLVTVGALVTWLVIALATHWLLGFDWPLSILFGTLTLVTGPTVIVPMLRVVRPKSTIANILRWEGIMIDPIGALLAVVVYSFIIASADGNGLSQSLTTFAGVIFLRQCPGRGRWVAAGADHARAVATGVSAQFGLAGGCAGYFHRRQPDNARVRVAGGDRDGDVAGQHARGRCAANPALQGKPQRAADFRSVHPAGCAP